MAITYKTQGIVLKCLDFKEADRLYTIFTKDHGKLVLRACGVKKINSKLAGHLENLNESSLFIAQAKGFPKIAGAQIISSFKNIKFDLDKLKLINYCVGIFNKLVLEEQKDEKIYFLLLDFLYWSNNNKINELIKQSFILKLLNFLGEQPDFSKSGGKLAKILNFLSQGNWSDIAKLRLSQEEWQQLEIVFNSFLEVSLS